MSHTWEPWGCEARSARPEAAGGSDPPRGMRCRRSTVPFLLAGRHPDHLHHHPRRPGPLDPLGLPGLLKRVHVLKQLESGCYVSYQWMICYS